MASEKGSDQEDKALKRQVLSEVKQVFKPEFLNRVDEIVVFHRLTRNNVVSIAEKLFKGTAERVAQLQIGMELTSRPWKDRRRGVRQRIRRPAAAPHRADQGRGPPGRRDPARQYPARRPGELRLPGGRICLRHQRRPGGGGVAQLNFCLVLPPADIV